MFSGSGGAISDGTTATGNGGQSINEAGTPCGAPNYWDQSGLDKTIDDNQKSLDDAANKPPAKTVIQSTDALDATGLSGVAPGCTQVTFHAVAFGVDHGTITIPDSGDCEKWATFRDMFGYLLFVVLVIYAYVSAIRVQ